MDRRKGNFLIKNLLNSKISLLILLLIALAFFIVGVFTNNGLLQGLGGVMVGASLSLFVTIVTSKEAVSQQNAKEANIGRKNDYYIPMFNDLKQVYDVLEDAKQKRLPYPQWIKGMDDGSHIFVRGVYPMPAFTNWSVYKEQPYRSNFTEKACKLFDEVQKSGADYNRAVNEAKDPVVKIINSQIDKAFRQWANTDDFKHWQEETKNGTIGSSAHFHQWNSYIDRYLHRTSWSEPEAQTIVWAYNILGWVLADDIDKASDSMQKIYRNDFQTYVTPDSSWFKDILEGIWVELQELPCVKKVSKVTERLLVKTSHAKDYMQERFNYIRDMYEGGEPPL